MNKDFDAWPEVSLAIGMAAGLYCRHTIEWPWRDRSRSTVTTHVYETPVCGDEREMKDNPYTAQPV